MSDEMTEEMVDAAFKLDSAAREYRKLYEAVNGRSPVVWLKNDESGEGIFISDGENFHVIRAAINNR